MSNKRKTISVIIPCHKTLLTWTKICVNNLILLSDRNTDIKYHIFHRGQSKEELNEFNYFLKDNNFNNVELHQQADTILTGGLAVQVAILTAITILKEEKADIQMLIDSDCLMLYKRWDEFCLDKINNGYDVVSANCRCDMKEFKDEVEWQLMFIKKELFNTFQLSKNDKQLHDFGHYWNDLNKYLVQNPSHCFKGKAATIVNENNQEFCVHMFYSSRKHTDVLAQPEKQWWLSIEEEIEAMERFEAMDFNNQDGVSMSHKDYQ